MLCAKKQYTFSLVYAKMIVAKHGVSSLLSVCSNFSIVGAPMLCLFFLSIGGVALTMIIHKPKKVTKKPVVALVGRFLCRGSLYEKGFGIVWESKLFPRCRGLFLARFTGTLATPSVCCVQRPRGSVREQTRSTTKRQSAGLALRVCEAN